MAFGSLGRAACNQTKRPHQSFRSKPARSNSRIGRTNRLRGDYSRYVGILGCHPDGEASRQRIVVAIGVCRYGSRKRSLLLYCPPLGRHLSDSPGQTSPEPTSGQSSEGGLADRLLLGVTYDVAIYHRHGCQSRKAAQTGRQAHGGHRRIVLTLHILDCSGP